MLPKIGLTSTIYEVIIFLSNLVFSYFFRIIPMFFFPYSTILQLSKSFFSFAMHSYSFRNFRVRCPSLCLLYNIRTEASVRGRRAAHALWAGLGQLQGAVPLHRPSAALAAGDRVRTSNRLRRPRRDLAPRLRYEPLQRRLRLVQEPHGTHLCEEMSIIPLRAVIINPSRSLQCGLWAGLVGVFFAIVVIPIDLLLLRITGRPHLLEEYWTRVRASLRRPPRFGVLLLSERSCR